jgi:hypothetical protein
MGTTLPFTNDHSNQLQQNLAWYFFGTSVSYSNDALFTALGFLSSILGMG